MPLNTPFGYLEKKIVGWFAKDEAVQNERNHYDILVDKSGTAERDELAVIKYLYERLNIIDGKAAALLTVNTLSLGITSIVLTTAVTSARVTNAQIVPVLHSERLDAALLFPALAMVAASIIAILLALAISRLKFDHISRDDLDHTLYAYQQRFFEITIARQKILAAARAFTGVAFLLYALLLALKLFGVGS